MKIELENFVGKPCNSRTAFEFVPKRDYALDLTEVAGQLRRNEVFIEIETPYLIMLKISGKDVSLFKSGKIIVKAIDEKGKAEKVAENLIRKMN